MSYLDGKNSESSIGGKVVIVHVPPIHLSIAILNDGMHIDQKILVIWYLF